MTLITGSMDHGQGHGTVFKQVLSEKLGIDADLIRYDSAIPIWSITASARSARARRSSPAARSACAAEKLIEKGKKIAAHMMEAATERRRLRGRQFHHRRHRQVGRSIGASRAGIPSNWGQLPNDVEIGFTERTNYGPSNAATFPSGAHICEVEIDAETGKLALTRYSAVDDVGTVLNPLICEGQIQGGIVQGLGQVMVRGHRL